MLECFVYTTNKSFTTPLRLLKIVYLYVTFNFDITKTTFDLQVDKMKLRTQFFPKISIRLSFYVVKKIYKVIEE